MPKSPKPKAPSTSPPGQAVTHSAVDSTFEPVGVSHFDSLLSSTVYSQMRGSVPWLTPCGEFEDGSRISNMGENGGVTITHSNQIPILSCVSNGDNREFISSEYGLGYQSPYGSSEFAGWSAPAEDIATDSWGFWNPSDQYVAYDLW